MDGEDGERVAAGVHGIQQLVVGVVGEHPWEARGSKTGPATAPPRPPVGNRPVSEVPVTTPAVRDDRVAGLVVGFHEDGAVLGAVAWGRRRCGGDRREADREGCGPPEPMLRRREDGSSWWILSGSDEREQIERPSGYSWRVVSIGS